MPKVYNKHHKDAPKSAVYVGRPSKWGNPYVIGPNRTREQVIEYYRQHVSKLHGVIQHELRGKDLVCFCAPKPCHADVLLEIANDIFDRQSPESGSPTDSGDVARDRD